MTTPSNEVFRDIPKNPDEDQKVAEWLATQGYIYSERDDLYHLWLKDSDRELGRLTIEAATFFYKATHPEPVAGDRHPIWQMMRNHGYVDETLARELYRHFKDDLKRILDKVEKDVIGKNEDIGELLRQPIYHGQQADIARAEVRNARRASERSVLARIRKKEL